MGRFSLTASLGIFAGLLVFAGGLAQAEEDTTALGTPPAVEAADTAEEVAPPRHEGDLPEGEVAPPTPEEGAPLPAAEPAPPAEHAAVPMVVEAPVLPPAPERRIYQATPTWATRGFELDPGCWQTRDACGRPLDWCGKPFGRWELVLEGTGTWLPSPEGPLGEPIPAGTAGLEWNRIGYAIEPGGRFTIRFATAPKTKVEARGTWYGEWSGTSRQVGAFGFSPPPGGTSSVIASQLDTESTLWGGELNVWREVRCCGRNRWNLGVGARYVLLDESARAVGGRIAGAAGLGLVRSDVRNDFLGGQIAAAWTYDVSRRFELGLIGKGLLGGLRREIEVQDAFILSGSSHRATNDDTGFGWGAEIEATLLYRITPRIGVTGGAVLLYLGKQVRATDAMDFSQASTGAVQARQKTEGVLVTTFFVGLHLNF